MKILIIKKNFLLTIFFFLTLLFIGTTIYYFSASKQKIIETINPISMNKDIKIDLNNDGKDEIIQKIVGENKVDFNIMFLNNDQYLSNEIDDNILFTYNNHWNPNFIINDISRDNIPEIMIQGFKNNKSAFYLFTWKDKKLSKIYSSNKNIFGILDSKNSKTPQCYLISSSEGISSFNSFMLINDTILDTTKENISIPSLDSINKFINILEVPYILDEIPDIFSNSINKKQLSLLWNLDKDSYSYAFQNAFFYDYEWNDSGEVTALKWKISFEKNKLKGLESDKDELVLNLDLKKENNYFKIISIEDSK